MLETLLKFLLAYAIGNVMGGQIVGALRGGIDLRTLGSGNVGATNALRTQGKGFALAVLLIDAGKGALAATLVPMIPWPWPSGFVMPQQWLAYLCGLGVALGHCYPLTLKLRGGKGVATLAGVFAALLWPALLWMLAVFVLLVILSGYVSLATMLAALTGVVWTVFSDVAGLKSATGVFTVAMAALVLFKHRKNLLRLWRGTEHRFDKARLLHRWLQR